MSRVDPDTERVRLGVPSACRTCNTELHGRFCHVCGERSLEPEEFRLRAFLERALGSAFDLDSRLYRSFRTLFRRPGKLTAEYMYGRRRPYLNPLQLFLLVNLLFFAMLSSIGGFNTFTTTLHFHLGQPGYGPIAQALVALKGNPESAAREAFKSRFNGLTPTFANSLIVLVVPIYAGMLALLLLRRRDYFVRHVVFSLHFWAFVLIALMALSLALRGLYYIGPDVLSFLDQPGIGELTITLILITILGMYLSRAFRRVYDMSPNRAVLAGYAGAVLLLPAIIVYRMLLFFAVYLALL